MILYFAGEFNPPPPPPPHIIMRNVGSRLLGNVALGQAPQWDGRGKRRKKRGERKSEDLSPTPVHRSARFAPCPSKGMGREFRHETCPSSRAPRASHASQIPFPFLSSASHAG